MALNTRTLAVGGSTVDLLTDCDRFIGLGSASIGGRQVRSGRLPIRPYTQTFGGQELASLTLLGVDEGDGGAVRLRLLAGFRPLTAKLMRDHSFDPIHALGDWDQPTTSGEARLDIVLRSATDVFGDVPFAGFSYGYEYASDETPLFYLYDRASWELDGNIAGGSVISQSACSDPIATFESDDVTWSTEGVLHFLVESGNANPIMTHNLPRWASHQAFDFQYKLDGATLLGVFDRVDLIRSVIQRDAGKGELKHFDKHIFNQTLHYATSRKAVLLSESPKTTTDQRNLWTWTFDEIHNRARAEYGLREEPLIPLIHCNRWDNFTIDGYLDDLLPAATSLGFEQVFIDNVNKSAMSERKPWDDKHYNMCCGHEYEPAPSLGGTDAVRRVVAAFRERGINVMSWTNNDQAVTSPNYVGFNNDTADWYVRFEDARLAYGGAYTNCMAILDFKKEAPRKYWTDSLAKTKHDTGLSSWLFDSFYNLGFMPVNYEGLSPTTQWKEVLGALKELQDAGIHFAIESFGPFGLPFHGAPAVYAEPDRIFAVYKAYLQVGYSTIPTVDATRINDADGVYRFFAHMASPLFTLYHDGKRLDELWGDRHKQALADYNQRRPLMHRRYLQEDGKSVLWRDESGKETTLFNFADRSLALSGTVHDITDRITLPTVAAYSLKAGHTYAIA